MDVTVLKSYDKTAEDMKRRMEALKRAQKSSQTKKKKKKKKVEYDAHEIATLLTRATHSMGVGEILVRANSKLQQLQMCVASGEYDINEVRAAIAHAKKMVKCARKKMKNLQEEERIESKGKKKAVSNANKERQARQKLERELGRIRRRHRGDEKKDMDEARRCYYREMANAEREAREVTPGVTVSIDGSAPASEEAVAEAAVSDAAPMDAGAVSVDVCL